MIITANHCHQNDWIKVFYDFETFGYYNTVAVGLVGRKQLKTCTFKDW
jgi:hypothetical protein